MQFCGRIGMMISPSLGEPKLLIMFPAEMDILIGKNNNFFETGIGFTYNISKYEDYVLGYGTTPSKTYYYHNHLDILRIGYRFQKTKGGFLFRIAALPLLIYKPEYIPQISTGQKYSAKIWAGLSCGYNF